MATKLVKGKSYSCLTLWPFKGKKAEGKELYFFDILRAKHVFHYLVKDQHIWLPEGQKIPPPKGLRNKRYCKWHNAYNHSMTFVEGPSLENKWWLANTTSTFSSTQKYPTIIVPWPIWQPRGGHHANVIPRWERICIHLHFIPFF